MENVDLCGRKFWYIQSGRLPGQNKTLVKTLITKRSEKMYYIPGRSSNENIWL